MDPSRVDSRYNLNYSMSSIGLGLSDQADLYGNPAAVAALGGRPPSGGLMQPLGNVPSSASGSGGLVGLSNRTAAGLMQNNAQQCQSLPNASTQQMPNMQRGIKRSGSDCHDDQQPQHQHHRSAASTMNAQQTMQSLDGCNSQQPQQQQQQQQQQASGNMVGDAVDDSYNSMQNKKSPPANGKKTKGRVKIKMEYIDNKLRRYTTFSKRKTGIMKKAYELSTLTGTQVMLLVASETGHVYTFATRKLQPMITSEAGKQLIQTCLNSPDPPNVGSGDQRMSATGFEETELSYNIADEDSKDARSPMSSDNESENSSDVDSSTCAILNNGSSSNNNSSRVIINQTVATTNAEMAETDEKPPKMLLKENTSSSSSKSKSKTAKVDTELTHQIKAEEMKMELATAAAAARSSHEQQQQQNLVYAAGGLSNIPQDLFMQLLQSGQLQLHSEQDGSGQRYVSIPLSANTLNLIKANKTAAAATVATTAEPSASIVADNNTVIKQELE